MPTLTTTEFPVTGMGGFSCFDGTNVWFARQSGFVITLIGLNGVTGAGFATYNITVTGSSSGASPILFLNGNLYVSVGGVTSGSMPNLVSHANMIVVDPGTGAVLHTFDFVISGPGTSAPGTGGVATDGTNVFCCWHFLLVSDTVVAMSLTQAGVQNWTQTYTQQNIYAATFDGTNFWVADGQQTTIRALDPATGATVHTCTVATSFLGDVDYNPVSNTVWTIDENNNTLINVSLVGVVISTTSVAGVPVNSPGSVDHSGALPGLMWTQAANAAHPGSPTSIEVSAVLSSGGANGDIWMTAFDGANIFHILVYDTTPTLIVDAPQNDWTNGEFDMTFAPNTTPPPPPLGVAGAIWTD